MLFRSVYIGGLSASTTRATVEEAQALILAGVQFTDTTSGLYTHQIDAARTITVDAEQTQIGRKIFAPLAFTDALRILKETLYFAKQLTILTPSMPYVIIQSQWE